MKEVPHKIQAYLTFQEELTIEDGLVLKGTRIVIPIVIYWLGINEQLEKLVLICELCLKYSKAKSKQTANMSLGQEILIYPWMKVVTNIFHFDSDSYLLIVN